MPTDLRCMIVTGASSGIGYELALQAAARGFGVVAVARRAERLEALRTRIESAGGICTTLVVDICAPDAPARIVAAAMERFGRIDIVVNNAGTGAAGTLLAQSDAAIDAQWRLHVNAPLRLSRAALPALRVSKGALAFVGSGLARVAAPGFGAYCAAKAAIRSVSEQLRRELRTDGIAVSYIDPGAVATEFLEASGLDASSGGWHVQPDHVARNILRGLERRARIINAVPLQTAAVGLAASFPWLADLAMSRVVAKPSAIPVSVVPAETTPSLTTAVTPDVSDPFEAALAPVARRMERVKLTPQFLRDLLVPETTIVLHDAAMRWAGMPNKNERAALKEALDALSVAGYIEADGEESWRVIRAAVSQTV